METWYNDSMTNTTALLSQVEDMNKSIYYTIQNSNPELAGCEPTILKVEVKEYLDWKWWIGGIISIIIAFFGVFGNVTSMVVLSRPKIREVAFNQLLICLCVVDTLFLACNSLSMAHALGHDNVTIRFARDCMDVFAHISLCASVLMVVALTFERHFAITSPHQYRVHLRLTKWWKHLSYYIVPVTFLSFFFNIPLFINLKRSWMEDVIYLKINLYLRMLHPMTTTGIVPVILLLILNVRITRGIMELQERSAKMKLGAYNNLTPAKPTTAGCSADKSDKNDLLVVTQQKDDSNRQSRLSALTAKRQKRSAMQNRREIKMAYITFAIVAIFFCFNLPRILVGGYEVSKTWLILHCVSSDAEYMPDLTFYRWDTISRLLMVINSSVNFLIYCTGSEQFKAEFYKMFFPSRCGKVENLGSDEELNNGLEDFDENQPDKSYGGEAPLEMQKKSLIPCQNEKFVSPGSPGTAETML